MTEVLDIIKDSGYSKEVEIWTDACYSGKTCFEAKDWWEQNKPKGLKLKALFVNASCYRYKKSVWGEFCKYKDKASKSMISK